MKVIATKTGFMGRLRHPGEEFDVPEGTCGSWFEPAGVLAGRLAGKSASRPVESARAKPKAVDRPADDLV